MPKTTDPRQPCASELEAIKFELRYDAEAGMLYRIGPSDQFGIPYLGTPSQGYRKVYIISTKKRYLAHHVVWFLCKGSWPVIMLDHKDQNGEHNWIDNLQEATSQMQGRNRKDNVRSWEKMFEVLEDFA